MARHDCCCEFDPAQFDPPLAGLGLVHVLILVICPYPHETLHPDQTDHDAHPPFIGTEDKDIELY